MNRKKGKEEHLDAFRGCMVGGAAGDALGYAVEFYNEPTIFARYGSHGIQSFDLDTYTGKALISDDTQMSLFTANAILYGDTRRDFAALAGNRLCMVALPIKIGIKHRRCPLTIFSI